MVLFRVALKISKSGIKDNDLVDNFNEDPQKPEPRKPVLENIWSEIERALPTIVQLVNTADKILKLIYHLAQQKISPFSFLHLNLS